jgi:glycosyltransferase involved in cell wall biosynthesis
MISTRILFFMLWPIPFYAAGWIRIEFFAQHFKKRGNEVAVAGAFSLKTLKKWGSKDLNGVQILNITPMITMSNLFSLLFNTLSSFFPSLISLLLLRPQIVVISVPNGEGSLGCYIATKLFRTKKVIFDYRDEWEDYGINQAKSRIYAKAYHYLKNLMTKCYANSDLVITTTKSFADKLSSRGVTNVEVVSNGADINIFRPYDRISSRSALGMSENDFVLVYSGGGAPYYRLDIIIRAMQKVSNNISNMKLLMIGQHDIIYDKMLDLSKQLGLSNNVFYLGVKTDKVELARIFSASDIGIVPYDANPLWRNSMPVKALEYVACGLPIIATVYEDSFLGKLICENKVGITAQPENIDSLAQAIERMHSYYRNSERISDEEGSANNLFIRQARERGVFLVQKNFDRNKLAERFLVLLEKTGNKRS